MSGEDSNNRNIPPNPGNIPEKSGQSRMLVDPDVISISSGSSGTQDRLVIAESSSGSESHVSVVSHVSEISGGPRTSGLATVEEVEEPENSPTGETEDRPAGDAAALGANTSSVDVAAPSDTENPIIEPHKPNLVEIIENSKNTDEINDALRTWPKFFYVAPGSLRSRMGEWPTGTGFITAFERTIGIRNLNIPSKESVQSSLERTVQASQGDTETSSAAIAKIAGVHISSEPMSIDANPIGASTSRAALAIASRGDRGRTDTVSATLDTDEFSYKMTREEMNLYPSFTIDIYNREENETCAICLKEYTWGCVAKRLNCNHKFHKICVDKYMFRKISPTCPVCKLYILPLSVYLRVLLEDRDLLRKQEEQQKEFQRQQQLLSQQIAKAQQEEQTPELQEQEQKQEQQSAQQESEDSEMDQPPQKALRLQSPQSSDGAQSSQQSKKVAAPRQPEAQSTQQSESDQSYKKAKQSQQRKRKSD